MVCGIWNNRCQELNAHYRLHHPELTQGIFTKSAQITKMLPSTSPCRLCQTPYKRGHTCNVATQLSALALHSLDLTCNHLSCDICALEFENTAQLHAHLGTVHEVQIHDWNAARDSLPESNGCSHCGQVYATRAGLRRHITEGRCKFFDPMATNTPLNAAAKWGGTLQAGDISKKGLTAHQRLQLTVTCQLCGETYSRCNDLSAHLQQTHAQLWAQSGEHVRFLLQTLAARIGCVCNPSTNDVSRTHICNAFRQLSMIFLTSEQEMLIPWNFHADALKQEYRQLLPNAHVDMMINALVDRDFSYLRHAPALLQLFRQQCVLCGLTFHPAALVPHQLAQHHDRSQWAAQIKFQLLQRFKREMLNDFHCKFCALTFNSEPNADDDSDVRQATVQAHLTSCCPVLHQLALILLPIHERSAHDGPVGSGDDEHLRSSGATDDAGQPIPATKRRRTLPQEVQKRQNSGRRAGLPEGIAGHGQAHGTGAHPTRSGNPDATQTDLLRFVRTNRTGQCTGHPDAAGSGVEEAEADRDGLPADAPNLSAEEPAQGTTDTPGEAVSELSGQSHLGYSGSTGGPPDGRLMAVPTMESQGEQADPIAQATHGHVSDVEGGPAGHGIAERGGAGHALPQPEASDCGSTMADRSGHPRLRNVDNIDGADTVDALDIDRSLIETTFTVPESPNADARDPAGGTERQEPGEGQEGPLTLQARCSLRESLANLVLDNPSHLCFANAALASFLWASLSRTGFKYTDWGIPASLFCDMLRSPDPYSVDSQPWYDGLTRNWEDNHGQADSAEFTQMLIQWVSPAFYCSYWHRRWTQCEKVLIHDHGDRFQPLFLQLEPTRVTNGMIRLTDMLRSWHGELGMNAALLKAPESLCVHLERNVQTSTGVIYKMQTPIIFQGTIEVPVFSDNTMECRWEQYQAVAAFAHYGESGAGHYRALLRTEPRHRGLDATAYWLDCDDGRKPMPCTYVPEGFMHGVTCVWLNRLDQLELHDWHAARGGPDTENTLLHLLTATWPC